MKTLKSVLCLVLAVLMLMSLTCIAASADEGSDEKITLRIGTTGYLGRFLSGLAPQESHSACNAVFDSIFRVDPWTKQYKSDVLDDWYWEDEHFFVMKLHDGVIFSNGMKATSEDLLFSYENHEERGSKYLSGMGLDLSKCEIRDEFTVALWCDQPNVAIFCPIHLYCKAWAREVGWDSPDWYYPVASGAYYVKEYVNDDYMILHLRDDYWKHSPDEYYVEEYYYKYYPEASSLYMELELGNLDLCAIQDNDYSRYMREDDPSRTYNVCLDPTGSTMYMNFGYKDNDIWYNKDLREAIAYGVDWESVGILTLGDFYAPNNGFAPVASPSYFDAGTRSYDPAKAAELLEKAGYKPGELTLKACMMDNPQYKNFGQAITYYLNEMGINIDIQYADVSASIANWIQGGYNNDINLMFAAGGAIQQNVKGSLNQVHLWPGVTWAYVDDAHFQEIYARLLDPLATAEETYATEYELQQYIFDECLIIPFAEMNAAFGYNSEIFTPELVQAITFSNRYQLTELGLKSAWGK